MREPLKPHVEVDLFLGKGQHRCGLQEVIRMVTQESVSSTGVFGILGFKIGVR